MLLSISISNVEVFGVEPIHKRNMRDPYQLVRIVKNEYRRGAVPWFIPKAGEFLIVRVAATCCSFHLLVDFGGKFAHRILCLILNFLHCLLDNEILTDCGGCFDGHTLSTCPAHVHQQAAGQRIEQSVRLGSTPLCRRNLLIPTFL